MKRIAMIVALLVMASAIRVEAQQRILRDELVVNTGDSTTWVVGSVSKRYYTDGWSEITAGWSFDDRDTTACCDSIRYFMCADWSLDGTTWIPSDSSFLMKDSLNYIVTFPLRPYPWMRLRSARYAGLGVVGGRVSWALPVGTVRLSVKGVEW